MQIDERYCKKYAESLQKGEIECEIKPRILMFDGNILGIRISSEVINFLGGILINENSNYLEVFKQNPKFIDFDMDLYDTKPSVIKRIRKAVEQEEVGTLELVRHNGKLVTMDELEGLEIITVENKKTRLALLVETLWIIEHQDE